jgi:cystathionine beta-lyase/cystathionine gamma-synthase
LADGNNDELENCRYGRSRHPNNSNVSVAVLRLQRGTELSPTPSPLAAIENTPEVKIKLKRHSHNIEITYHAQDEG